MVAEKKVNSLFGGHLEASPRLSLTHSIHVFDFSYSSVQGFRRSQTVYEFKTKKNDGKKQMYDKQTDVTGQSLIESELI